MFASKTVPLFIITLVRPIKSSGNHYENTPIQIYRKFHLPKLKKIQIKNSDVSHSSAQNIDCGTR